MMPCIPIFPSWQAYSKSGSTISDVRLSLVSSMPRSYQNSL